jgi:hypothetical protein
MTRRTGWVRNSDRASSTLTHFSDWPNHSSHAASVVCVSLAAVLLVAVLTPATATASPNAEPLCKSIHVSVAIYNVIVNNNATNSSLSWDESPAGYPTILFWGNSSAYGWPSMTINASTTYSNGSGVYYSPPLNYLKPSTTYYFEIYVSLPAGWCGSGPWAHPGTWTTKSDSLTTFSGQVEDSSGATPPVNSVIYVSCFTPVGKYFTDTLTTGGGYFSVSLPGTGCWPYGSSEIFDLEYLNAAGGVTWVNHWNETLVLYAPGYYQLYSQLNYKTYVPSSVEFVHTPYADLSSYSSTIYTTTGNTWEFAGNGGSTSESAQDSWGTNSIPAGDSLLVSTEWYTTGTGVFNATGGRIASMSGLTFFDETGARFSVNGWTDWQTSAPSSGFCESFNSSSAQWTLTIGGSVTVSSGYDIDLSVSAPIAGSPSVTVPVQNTLGSTSGETTTVIFTLTNPNPGSYESFLINTQGGSSSASGVAVVAHVWQVASC